MDLDRMCILYGYKYNTNVISFSDDPEKQVAVRRSLNFINQ